MVGADLQLQSCLSIGLGTGKPRLAERPRHCVAGAPTGCKSKAHAIWRIIVMQPGAGVGWLGNWPEGGGQVPCATTLTPLGTR